MMLSTHQQERQLGCFDFVEIGPAFRNCCQDLMSVLGNV